MRGVIWLEYLNREMERALRIVARHEGDNANRLSIEKSCGDPSLVTELARSGHVDIRSSERDGGGADYLHVTRTTYGRCYFEEKRRDRLRRWAPVLASAAIGVAGTLLGVVATLLLA